MSSLGLLKYFLGFEVKQGHGHTFVSQRRHAENFLTKIGMLYSRKATPMNSNEILSMNDGTGVTNAKKCQRLEEGLLYLTHTRLDLIHTVSIVSRHMQCSTQHHLGAIRRIIHHVAGTMDYGLLYKTSDQFKITRFMDSDWGGSLDDRKSIYGWVYTLGSAAVA